MSEEILNQNESATNAMTVTESMKVTWVACLYNDQYQLARGVTGLKDFAEE